MALNTPINDWHTRVVWIVGASSGIGRATASRLHLAGATVIVSARSRPALEAFVSQHAGSIAAPVDITDIHDVRAVAGNLAARGLVLDMVFVCAGHYRAQQADQFDLDEMLKHNNVNYVGTLHVLDAVLPAMVKRRRGHISLMGSVAGYRGLPRALAYGPTKAALNNLAESMYLDLRDVGVDVSIVNPGFVETPLTAQNTFRMPALISTEEAADQIVAGWARGQFEVHFPRRFTLGLKTLKAASHGAYFAAVRWATGAGRG